MKLIKSNTNIKNFYINLIIKNKEKENYFLNISYLKIIYDIMELEEYIKKCDTIL